MKHRCFHYKTLSAEFIIFSLFLRTFSAGDLVIIERSPAKHGRLGLIISWVMPKTLKMISAAYLALTLSI